MTVNSMTDPQAVSVTRFEPLWCRVGPWMSEALPRACHHVPLGWTLEVDLPGHHYVSSGLLPAAGRINLGFNYAISPCELRQLRRIFEIILYPPYVNEIFGSRRYTKTHPHTKTRPCIGVSIPHTATELFHSSRPGMLQGLSSKDIKIPIPRQWLCSTIHLQLLQKFTPY